MLQAGDRQHRRAVHLGIVEAVQKMDSAGTRGGNANAQPSCIFGVGACGKGRRLFVAHMNEPDAFLVFAQSFKTPLMPSPGSPKIVSTPQSIRRSTSTSEAFTVAFPPSAAKFHYRVRVEARRARSMSRSFACFRLCLWAGVNLLAAYAI